jgi:penicillin amidase
MDSSITTEIGAEDLKAVLPDLTGTLNLAGLDGPVTVYRDRRGIPHVQASSLHDAFFAQGFVTAQDRLWHMDWDRRRALGRWAEIAGPAGVEQDKLMRRFRLGASAKADFEVVSLDTQAMLESYAGGVNAFIQTASELPIEYRIIGSGPEPWEPWHSMAVFKVRHILMGSFERKLWNARMVRRLGYRKAQEAIPESRPGELLIVPPGAEYSGPTDKSLPDFLEGAEWPGLPAREEGGSNNWAVHGSRTTSGAPLLAGDPHRGLEAPSVYYQNHIACDEFDVVGLSFPGVPGFPHFGHNAHVAWCVTHAMADYQDLYIERFKSNDSLVYEFKGEWEPAEVSTEVIQVAGGPSEEFEIISTRHGSIVAGDPTKGTALALRYTATAEPIKAFDSISRMLTATSVDEMDESMRDWVDPANNFVCVDVQGDIKYLTRGRLPIRPKANAWVPVPGWSGDYEWSGYVPFEEMPRSRNPETGFIVTANNRIADEDYPHYIGLDYDGEHRARCIFQTLETLGSATVEDMASVHGLRTSIPARELCELLDDVEMRTEAAAEAKRLLHSWDCRMDRDRPEPTIFSAFHDALAEAYSASILGPLAEEMAGETGRGAPSWYGRTKSSLHDKLKSVSSSGEMSELHSLLAGALETAVAKLKSWLGEEMSEWTWGRVHRTSPKHALSAAFPNLAQELNPPSVGTHGDGFTPLAGSYSAAEPYIVTSASMARYVFDTSNWDNSRWVVPLGASGHPGSPHYSDQTDTWANVALLPMLYDWESVSLQYETRQSLLPGTE